MKRIMFFLCLAALAVLVSGYLFLAGCGGGGGGGGSSPQSKFVITANTESDGLTLFTIDKSTGELTLLSETTLPVDSAPTMVAQHPNRRFIYVANSNSPSGGTWLGASTISVFGFNSDNGALTEIPGSPFAAGSVLINIAITPSGKWLFGTDTDSGEVLVFGIDASTGQLTPAAAPAVAANGAHGIAVHSSGKFLFVGSDVGSGVYSFAINAATGGLTAAPNSPYSAPGANVWLAPTPDGKFLYAGATASGAGTCYLNGFSINGTTGELTPLSGFPEDVTAYNIKSFAVHPSGKFLYTANWSDGSVAAGTIDRTTGALTELAGSPYAAGGNPKSVVVDSTGKFLYVANRADGTVSAFTINTTSGELAALDTYSAWTGMKFLTTLK